MTFPTVSAGRILAKYPVQRTNRQRSKVHVFSDLTEQRYAQPATAEFTLTYQRLKTADVATLRGFWDAAQGSFDTTWDLPWEGTTFSQCQFIGQFAPVMNGPALWDLTLHFRCRTPGSFLSGVTVGAAYPTLTAGAIAQRPFTSEDRYHVVEETLDCGASSTWSQLGTPLKRWKLSYPAITQTEANKLEKFFETQHGQLGQFNFTDDLGVTSTVRFDQDALVMKYVGPGQWSTEVNLAQLP